jgi:hypothetical protein
VSADVRAFSIVAASYLCSVPGPAVNGMTDLHSCVMAEVDDDPITLPKDLRTFVVLNFTCYQAGLGTPTYPSKGRECLIAKQRTPHTHTHTHNTQQQQQISGERHRKQTILPGIPSCGVRLP